MKGFILKDLLNIKHNAKSMLFILVVFAAAFFHSSGIEGYIFICATLCSTMIVTTFSFDDLSKWTPYAMVMPSSRKDLVLGKFITLAIFDAFGSAFGFLAGIFIKIMMEKTVVGLAIGHLLLLSVTAWAASFFLGSISIPLVFKFGAERGRILILASYLLPFSICYGVYRLLLFFGVEITRQLIFLLICFSPALALIWGLAMYQISCRIFSGQDL